MAADSPRANTIATSITCWDGGRRAWNNFPQTGVVVASPEIEAAWQARPQFADPPFAAVNYKFVYERTDGREK